MNDEDVISGGKPILPEDIDLWRKQGLGLCEMPDCEGPIIVGLITKQEIRKVCYGHAGIRVIDGHQVTHFQTMAPLKYIKLEIDL